MLPTIICHMVTSVDARLHLARFTAPHTKELVEQTLAKYYGLQEEFKADGWISGRKTMEDFAQGEARQLPIIDKENLKTTYKADPTAKRFAISIDPRGTIYYGRNTANGGHLVVVLSEKVKLEYLAQLRDEGISYVFAGPDGRNIKKAMATLKKEFGIKKLILEGGAITSGIFLKEGLLNEISLLIYPGIDGLKGVSNIFEYPGQEDEKPAWGQSLRLIAAQPLENELLWLRYSIEKSKTENMEAWEANAANSCCCAQD